MRISMHKLPVLIAPLFLTAISQAQNDVLILDGTVSGGIASVEAQSVIALGYTPIILNDAAWGALTAVDFQNARGIVLGDNFCGGSAAAATANALLWGPLIDGNVIIVGTDPRFHAGQGGQQLIDSGLDFALDVDDKTGAYICLSCYFHGVAPLTPVPLLDGLVNPGDFTVKGVGCFDDAHIVASHPAMDPLTDAQLSNWGCSVHEAFDSWPQVGPDAFLVLAIAENAGGRFNAPDGTVGTPYILARGEDLVVISDITLSPANTENIPVGTPKTLTATVLEDGLPVAGVLVTFEILAGPCMGTIDTDTTNAAGEATFTYACGSAGIDTVVATFTDSSGNMQTSNQAFCEWIAECFLVVGSGDGPETFAPGVHTFLAQVSGIREHYPVLRDDIPDFVIPETGGRQPMLIQSWGQSRVAFEGSVQVLMWNPWVFPTQPEQYTNGMHVVVFQDGRYFTRNFGTSTGMTIWPETGTNAEGQRVLRFRFDIPGI